MPADSKLAHLAALNHDSHIAALDYRNRIYKAHHKRGEFHRASDIHWCRLGDGAFNIVYGANVPAHKADGLIERVNREVETWNETARWFASTNDSPRDLGERLKANSWAYSFAWPEMTLDLGDYSREASESDTAVEHVKTEKVRQEWLHVVREGYDLQPPMSSYKSSLTLAFLAMPRSRFQLYLARNPDGAAVACGTLFVQKQIAEVFHVATHPDHRRHGHGAELMRQLIDVARRKHCVVVALQSSEMGRSVYQKLGFVETGLTEIYKRG